MTHYPHDTDLRDNALARWYVKHEIVLVQFAGTAGAIRSREGLNHYAAGDALITGSTGDRWSVSRDRFDAKYLPEPGVMAGHAGRYRNRPAAVLALQQHTAFSVAREAGGDVIHGQAGDWLMQYAPEDHGIVQAEKFARVYQLSEPPVPAPWQHRTSG